MSLVAFTLAAVLAAPAPSDIFRRAQAAWSARTIPAYESFELPCDQTFLDTACEPGDDVEFIVRFSDGRTFARSLPHDGRASKALLHGGFIAGPASAPLGFYRRTPGVTPPPSPPPNLAPDPFSPQTITTVQSVDRAYEIRLLGDETLRGSTCFHLALRPLRDPDQYPLRELWVDELSYEVVRLTYSRPFDTTRAVVHYDFAAIGTSGIWTIVHIDAEASKNEVFSHHTERVSEELSHIAFPESEPAPYFEP